METRKLTMSHGIWVQRTPRMAYNLPTTGTGKQCSLWHGRADVSHVPKTLWGYGFCSFGCTGRKILGGLEIPGGHSCILLGSILYTKNIIIAGGPDIRPDIFES